MLFDRAIRFFGARQVLGACVIGAVGVATLAATHPTAVLATLASKVSCATTAACVQGANTSTGPGVGGTSAKGIGITASGVTGLTAAGTTGLGIKGVSTGSYGVEGVSSKKYGVYGTSQAAKGGYGVYGTTASSTGDGVVGYESGAGLGVLGTATAGAGVTGISSSIVGVQGEGDSADGINAFSTSGYGLYAHSASTLAIYGYADSGTALYGISAGTGDGVFANSTGGYGVEAYSNGPATLYALNSNGTGADVEGSIGVVGRAPASNGYPLFATDQNNTTLFYVDGVGDVYYAGSLNSFARTKGGATIRSFSPKTTAPTIEDTGTAQLVGGKATVRLDAAFAASIDTKSAYRVFVTANGETNGLYVPVKSPAGFIVREAHGGSSSVTFDYRVVAAAMGQSARHMSLMYPAVAPAPKVSTHNPPPRPTPFPSAP